MCGIAGYFGLRQIDDERIQACLSLMRRRGPDHSAARSWTNNIGRHVYLLHSRLNIIDLDARSNQPFHIGDKWISYNGELYNYLEVRSDLRKQGYSFSTESDTEALLRGLDHYGWDVLDRYEGMWAFAVYDEAEGSVTLCRDRFGEKPLYIYRDQSGLYFGSEVKFITALIGHPLEINIDHLYRYLVNGYRALYKGPQTFFVGLEEVSTASFLRLNRDGSEETSNYWKSNLNSDETMSYDDAVAGARERLMRSVELRLRADVPLAFCMSGGVDSNSLIGLAKNVFNYDVHGFTIVNSDSRYEESEIVDYAVKEFAIRHTSISLNVEGFLTKLRMLVRQHDAPVYTISYYAQWLLMQSIAEHGYRISVSGTGADELYSGYYDHHLAYLQEVYDDTALYTESLKAWEQHVKPLVRNPFLQNPRLFIDDPEFREHIYFDSGGFSEYLVSGWSERFTETKYVHSLLRNRMLNELFHEAIPVILHEDDLNAMYFSIENRSPFLDRDLFEFCHSIPAKCLIRDGRAKSILRDSMRGIVPERVLANRRKVGFNAPIYSFLDVKNPSIRQWLLDDGPIFQHVHRVMIEKLTQKSFLQNSESKFLFYFVCAKMFLEEFAC
ncbi:MAG TPA: asparagine synthase (glutamine-hydrolyzing) [Pyrinomonadaceae bacterium]|nr:asparagine synthase (glutamine-hydrolyzing) [Pyrinomonadaceae bacterium]